MFQGNIWTELFFLTGILINSRTACFLYCIWSTSSYSTSLLTRDRCRNIKYGIDGL
ncbi:hypothetical protein [Phocaeicola massiliensis]|uniref:hypothetical protein n=1 Tax=Phocaeicola massiliensis TaxID=204516 RepID=UPI0032EDDF9B